MPSSDPLQQARAKLGGQRATVVGLAREGLDLARFLTNAGASVTLVDRKAADELASAIRQIANVPVEYALGGDHPEIAERSDVVFASPGVHPDNPLLVAARERGVRVTSLVELLFELCPAPIVGVTGSAGKTTTTSLLGEMFRAAGRDVFVGGNIGRPLLGELGRIRPSSWVVMELSSFQLEPLCVSPRVALVTNVTPNHLDRHPSMAAYWAAKGQILAHQAPTDWAVLNADDEWSRRYRAVGKLLRFSLEGPVEGAYLQDNRLVLLGQPLLHASEVPLRGRHNLANVLAACATGRAAGLDSAPMVAAIRAFPGVSHRLETVAERDGVRFVNDSIATAPERSIAALRAFDEPVVLIAGGRDKHLPMDEWAGLIVRRCRCVVLLGEMEGLVREAIRRADPAFTSVVSARSMDDAVRQAADAARPGDVVLLSPGGTSFDLYADFEARGRDFARAAQKLDGAAGPGGAFA